MNLEPHPICGLLACERPAVSAVRFGHVSQGRDGILPLCEECWRRLTLLNAASVNGKNKGPHTVELG